VVEERLDLAIRVRVPPLEDSELAVRALGQSRMALVCSRWFMAQHGTPNSPNDLGKLPTLSMTQPGNSLSWQFLAPDGTAREVRHTPRLATDDLATLRAAALEGIGIALLPVSLIRDKLADGSLLEVLPELKLAPGVVHVVFASRRGLVPAVRALIDALAVGYEELERRGLR
jgi:DNA-binding transcriptional LysR family regulator